MEPSSSQRSGDSEIGQLMSKVIELFGQVMLEQRAQHREQAEFQREQAITQREQARTQLVQAEIDRARQAAEVERLERVHGENRRLLENELRQNRQQIENIRKENEQTRARLETRLDNERNQHRRQIESMQQNFQLRIDNDRNLNRLQIESMQQSHQRQIENDERRYERLENRQHNELRRLENRIANQRSLTYNSYHVHNTSAGSNYNPYRNQIDYQIQQNQQNYYSQDYHSYNGFSIEEDDDSD